MFATTTSFHEPHTTGFSGSAVEACYSPLHVFHHGPAWGPELGEPLVQASPPPRQVTGPGSLCMSLVVTQLSSLNSFNLLLCSR